MRRLIPVAAVAAAAICGPAAAQDGEAAFKAKCATCHSQKKVLDGVRKKPDAERASHLEKFLPGHFPLEAGERKAICDYLVKAAADE
jgi:cytochrome c